MLSGMEKLKKVAGAGAVLAFFGAVAAAVGPFITSEAIEGLLERVRRSFSARGSDHG
jgi:hypothetical protein